MGKDKKDKTPKKAKKAKKADGAAPAAKRRVDLKQAAAQVVDLAKSPAVRELAVAALGAAAAKIAESTQARRKARAKAAEDGGDDADRLRQQAVHLGEVIRAAALEGARQLLEELERPSDKKRGKPKAPVSRPGSGGDE